MPSDLQSDVTFEFEQSEFGGDSEKTTPTQETRPPLPYRSNTLQSAYGDLGKRDIRLFKILRYEPLENAIYGKLQTFCIDTAPKYFAVSHTWVEAIAKRYIDQYEAQCEGQPLVKVVFVPEGEGEKEQGMEDSIMEEKLVSTVSHGEAYLTKNLSDLFRVHYSRLIGKRLWIDTICIEQGNHGEVADQVLIMGEIFSMAQKVIVWLSSFKPDVDRTYFIITKLLPKIRDKRETFQDRNEFTSWMSQKDPCDNNFWTEMGVFLPTGWNWVQTWAAYHRFFVARAWFKRVWVLQEVALGKKIDVWAADKTWYWVEMESIERYLEHTNWHRKLATTKDVSPTHLTSWKTTGHIRGFRSAANTLNMAFRQDQRKEKQWPNVFRALLMASRTRDATKPEDRVLSVIGPVKAFMGDTEKRMLVGGFPSTCDAFTWSCKLLVENSQLNILALVQDKSETITKPMPSWVVDWGVRLGDTHNMWRLYDPCKNLTSLGDPEPKVKGGVLSLKAVKYGVITKHIEFHKKYSKALDGYVRVLQHLRNVPPPKDSNLTWFEILLMSVSFSCFYFDYAEANYVDTVVRGFTAFVEYIWRKYPSVEHAPLINELVPISQSIFGNASKRPLFDSICLLILAASSRPNPTSVPTGRRSTEKIELTSLGRRFDVETEQSMGPRCPVILNNNVLGTAPKSAQEGDEVWLLAGQKFPIVVRPKIVDGDFEYMGPGYVHGIMNGELKHVQDVGPLVEISLV